MKPLKLFSGLALLLFLFSCHQDHQEGKTANSNDGTVLPFELPPSASIENETLADSKMERRKEPSHLPDDAPNIVIVLIDDVNGEGSTFDFSMEGKPLQMTAFYQ